MFFSDANISTIIIFMLPVIINLWGIYHASRHSFPSSTERTYWMGLCVFLPILGGVIYFVFGRPRGVKIK